MTILFKGESKKIIGESKSLLLFFEGRQIVFGGVQNSCGGFPIIFFCKKKKKKYF